MKTALEFRSTEMALGEDASGAGLQERSKASGGWLANRSSLTSAGGRRLVDQNLVSWNRIAGWLTILDSARVHIPLADTRF
jgi:hypothetical protein